MKLYDFKAAPNPRRVRLFLAEKGIEVPRVQVDIIKRENREPWFLEKNPLGGLPLLELDDGSCISESMAICRYFEELHPDPPLFGRSAREKADIEMWNRRVELNVLSAIGMVWQHGSPLLASIVEQVPGNVAPARKRAQAGFALLDEALAGRPFIAGDALSIADLTALAAIDFGHFIELPPDPSLTALARWHAEMRARPSAKA